MSKKKTEALSWDAKARVIAEAERDLALATIEALKKEMAAAPPPAPVVAPVAPAPDPLAIAKQQYRELRETNPYAAAELLLNWPAVASRE